MNCEGCGSEKHTVWHEAGQGIEWCAEPSGCNTDDYTEGFLKQLLQDYRMLERKVDDEDPYFVTPIHRSHQEAREWVEMKLTSYIEHMYERMGY